MKPHRIIRRSSRLGDPSSKYGYDRNGEQFEKDIQQAYERGEKLYSAFVEFMKSQNVTPEDFQQLFHKYYDDFLA